MGGGKTPDPSEIGQGVDEQKREKPPQARYEAPGWLTALVIIVITLVWAASVLGQLANPDYHPPSEINFIFMAVLGVILGTQFLKGLHRD